MNRRHALFALLALAGTACSRGISVGSATPGSTYEVFITNSAGTSMDVSYNDGKVHSLGTIATGSTQRFIIPSSKTTVSITGRASSGTKTSGPYELTLSSGARLTLR